MKHLNRDQQYKTVKKAIEKDNPEVADSMDRMADSISASLEVLSTQIGGEKAMNPSYVIPMAIEIFKDSQSEDGEKCYGPEPRPGTGTGTGPEEEEVGNNNE